MPHRHTARVRFEVPAPILRAMIPPSVGAIEPDGDERSVLVVGADSFNYLAGHLVSMGVRFEVLEPDSVRDEICVLARRMLSEHTR